MYTVEGSYIQAPPHIQDSFVFMMSLGSTFVAVAVDYVTCYGVNALTRHRIKLCVWPRRPVSPNKEDNDIEMAD